MSVTTGLTYAPVGAFVESSKVRSYEVNRTGHISMGVVLRHLESLATEASAALGFDFRWYEEHNAAWVVREMNLVLGALPGIGDDLRLATWVSDFKRVQAQREYAIWLPAGMRQVARASARWAYVDRIRGVPQRLHDELLGAFAVLGSTMRPRALSAMTEQDELLARGELLLTARDYESDSQQHINNCVYADWLGEGLHLALASARDATGLVTRPRFYRIEYVRPAQPGDEIRITTTVARRGSRALAVHQDVTSATDGALYVRSRSTHLRMEG
ncbi:MAG TPA: acyl-ACP thioesterase domain-containing protein [Ktedonobacterales bacterium]